MKLTSNYNLKKPDGTDVVNIQDFNENSDKIDLELKKVDSSLKDMENNLSQISNPNLLINEKFTVAKRGTDFTITNNRLYTVDRWRAGADTGTIRVRRLDNKILRLEPAGNGNMVLNQMYPIEELDLRGKTVTLSVCMRASHPINMFVYYADRSNVWHSEIARWIPSNTKWSTYTITGTLPSDYKYINMEFNADTAVLSSGAWSEFAWVKLEVGSVATPFVPRSYGEELALCQRYYQEICFNGKTIVSDSNQFHVHISEEKMRIMQPTFKFKNLAFLHTIGNTPPINLSKISFSTQEYGRVLYTEWLDGLPPKSICTINASDLADNLVSDICIGTLDAEIY
ncbi:hypothetical protein UT300005_31760 [Clostridium sp. CTA-5]